MNADNSPWFGDVIVIGSGPSGSAVATVLATSGARVALVGNVRTQSWPGETLPPGSSELVGGIFGASILDGQMRAYATRASWETEELHETDALANPLGEGWILDRGRFDDGGRLVAARAGAVVIEGQATAYRDTAGTWRVTANGKHLQAGFLVDATGRSAGLARRMGARRIEPKRMLASIRVLGFTGDLRQATTIESVDAGWWYSTPIPGGGRVLALISDEDLVPRGPTRAAWWVESLTRTSYIRELLGVDEIPEFSTTSLAVYPAGTGWLSALHGDGWAAVGDSAVHFDPLSSQGLLTGMLMGARLGECLGASDLGAWERDYRMLIDEHVALSELYYGLVNRHPGSIFWDRRAPERG